MFTHSSVEERVSIDADTNKSCWGQKLKGFQDVLERENLGPYGLKNMLHDGLGESNASVPDIKSFVQFMIGLETLGLLLGVMVNVRGSALL
jgi:hypothetical protein